MTELQDILTRAVENNASDVHINVGMPPIIRHNTELISIVFPVITDADAQNMIIEMVGESGLKKLKMQKDLGFTTELDTGHRFRVNAHFQRGTIAISFRII